MPAKQLEAYLYYDLQLVGLRPTGNVNLLDLLVRVKARGIFGGTRLLNLGSFLLYNRPCPTSTDAVAKASDEVREGLRMLEAREYDSLPTDGIFQVRQDYNVHRERISTGAGLSATILQYISTGLNTSAEMLCTMSNLSHHTVIDSAIHDLFLGDEPDVGAEAWPPLWKPDVRKISRACHPKGGADGSSLEIWIVKEKVYCAEISFEDVQQSSANASIPVHGTRRAVEAQANRRGAVNRYTRGFHQLGFKAVRLFYEHGDLREWRPDMGASVPTLRNHDVESCHDRYPHYHMGAFFHVEPPPTHSTRPDGANVSLELVDIETLATES